MTVNENFFKINLNAWEPFAFNVSNTTVLFCVLVFCILSLERLSAAVLRYTRVCGIHAFRAEQRRGAEMRPIQRL